MAITKIHCLFVNLRPFLRYLSTKPSAKKTLSWSFFRKAETEKKPKPPQECCRKRKDCEREDPDFSSFEGQPYKTCGPAYVVQKDVIPPLESSQKEEDLLVQKIEADVTIKDSVKDPMPPFRSVAQRLLDLTERRLHPFYKRFMSIPKKSPYYEIKDGKVVPYKCMSGPVAADQLPEHLNLNKELLDKKNIFADFKKIELPKQLLVRMLEMDKNRKPTLEPKKNAEKK